MNVIDIIIIIFVLIFGLLGLKRGAIKSLVQLVGIIAITILAFVLKDYLANFLMDFMPFFNFSGPYAGITSMNILLYEMLSFVVIFILLYCILNILITLSGLIEKLLKVTIILAIPSKIMGAILGIIEGIVLVFIVSFIALHIPQTETEIRSSKIAIVILERTPFVGDTMKNTTVALENIHKILEKAKNATNKNAANIEVLQELIRYNVVSKETVNKLIKDKKIDLGTTTIA